MPAKFLKAAVTAVIGGGAAWLAFKALDYPVPFALPLLATALIGATLMNRVRRASANA